MGVKLGPYSLSIRACTCHVKNGTNLFLYLIICLKIFIIYQDLSCFILIFSSHWFMYSHIIYLLRCLQITEYGQFLADNAIKFIRLQFGSSFDNNLQAMREMVDSCLKKCWVEKNDYCTKLLCILCTVKLSVCFLYECRFDN